MKPLAIPPLAGTIELRKQMDELEIKIHAARKLGADVRLAAWNLQIARGKLQYATASVKEEDLAKAKAWMLDAEKELTGSGVDLDDKKKTELNKIYSLLDLMAKEGLDLLTKGNIVSAKLLYKQTQEITKRLPEAPLLEAKKHLSGFEEKLRAIEEKRS